MSGGGWSSEAVKPLIVNMSLAASRRYFEGRTLAERKLDAIVWGRRQLYVVANSNDDIHGFSNFGAAKNSLAVGAVLDSGSLAEFSSHGPTADGRLVPQVVGTGVSVNSAAGNGSRGGYDSSSGTSMASPSVAGVAALLMDAVPAHGQHPALARARLMASAIRPDVWLENAAAFPSDNSNGPGTLQMRYGLGKVSARTAVLNRDRTDGWLSGSAVSDLEDGEYAHVDIEVPDGASRLDLVLTWDEPPTDTVASAVLNDLDLWLDRGDCDNEPCGSHASTSRVDNVEWIVVQNPAPGTYRAKVAASRVYTEAPRAALAWTIIRGPSTPALDLSVDRETVEVDRRRGGSDLRLRLSTDGYVAAGTRLHIDCRSQDGSPCAVGQSLSIRAEREDGITRRIDATTGGPGVGETIELGELGAGETWEAVVSVGSPVWNDAVRLYFKASAWNANSASASVMLHRAGSDEVDVPEATAPPNDRFVNAAVIEGDRGSEELDLLTASTEPGEPVYTPYRGRPAGSVWYSWRARSSGKTSFSVTPRGAQHRGWGARVDVFRGDRISGLDSVASGEHAAQFFADSGEVYWIRVSHVGTSEPLRLNWTQGPRPANDDFGAAAVLGDASGAVEGSNEGATLEPGEFFGDLAATVWYRWTAPTDGAWRFSSSATGLRVLAFVGESVSELRLVSGFPSAQTTFPAHAGELYWIAVASESVRVTGAPYELEWTDVGRTQGNDYFSDAREISGEASSSHPVAIDAQATVEPREPVESGIRTKWWSWTAPADGYYTWRLDEVSNHGNRLMVSVFEGENLSDLRLIATNGEQMAFALTFSATANQRYMIAAGLPANDPFAMNWAYQNAHVTLEWGPAPGNDRAGRAAALAGVSGSVSGSNAFATGATGERSDILGRSTLWWTYEAPDSGWLRFSVEGDEGTWALVVHGASADGLEILASSSWQRSDNQVLFEAQAGVRYRISLGTSRGGRGGEFTLRWGATDDPGWLRYVGQLADDDRDSRHNSVEIREPGDMAMHSDGTALYLASGNGLLVFERNSTTGGLDHRQVLTELRSSETTSLHWDSHRDRLLANSCSTWYSFGVPDDGSGLEYLGEIAVADDPGTGTCGKHLMLDADGAHLYRVSTSGIDHFAVEEGGALRFVGTNQGTFLRAVLSNDGTHVYAVNSESVVVFERDAASGELNRMDFEEAIHVWRGWGTVPLAITDDDAHLFVFDREGDRTILYSLEDRSRPVRLADLPSPGFEGTSLKSSNCRFAAPRREAVAVDVFCPALAFSVSWMEDDTSLQVTDWIGEWRGDSFNGAPLPSFGEPLGFAASPDGRHMYLSTPQHGIVIIARGSPVRQR